MPNNTLNLLNALVDNFIKYESESGCFELTSYKNRFTLEVGEISFHSMRRDMKNLYNSVDMMDFKYKGCSFTIKRHEE